ncbi:hypothetical protein P154DRAFT_28197 [Amniculicola lignicola CBS 123094]|uniref:Phosphoglycerate mutase-like protein n=1 Tax=Amniculicola lignicola CBS 123094 TaxID=1392246 RepID=A0A6A5VZU8_9PLEO|nr:hypothetical protein P154DRAFT_28197 [Amniculicola lignicola CBS 123094]
MLSQIHVITNGETTGIKLDHPAAPTGNPLDQMLSDQGLKQAQRLADKFSTYDDINYIYASPYHQCLQTITPLTEALSEKNASQPTKIRVLYALGDFVDRYQENSSPYARNATRLADLVPLFSNIDEDYDPGQYVYKSEDENWNETLVTRVAEAMDKIIGELDNDKTQPQGMVICTHPPLAAAIRRVVLRELSADGRTGDACVSQLVRQPNGCWSCPVISEPISKPDRSLIFRRPVEALRRWGRAFMASFGHPIVDHFGNNPYRVNPSIYLTMFVFLLLVNLMPLAIGTKLIPVCGNDDFDKCKVHREWTTDHLKRVVALGQSLVQFTLFLFPPLLA